MRAGLYGSGLLRPSLFRPRGTAPSDLKELLAEGRTRYHCLTWPGNVLSTSSGRIAGGSTWEPR